MEPFIMGIILMAVFIFFLVIAMLELVSAPFLLFIMSILIPLIAGISPGTVVTTVLTDATGKGVCTYANIFFTIALGGWLGYLIVKLGIAQDIIRRAAELGGDKPYITGILLLAACSFLFVALYGVGPVIMIGLIVIPILMQLGYPRYLAAGLYIFSCGVGFQLNLASWAYYAVFWGLELADIWNFAVYISLMTFIFGVIYLTVEMRRAGLHLRWAADVGESKMPEKRPPIYSLLTPAIPVILVISFKWTAPAAFLAGILYAAITAYRGTFKGLHDTLMRAMYDCMADLGWIFLLIASIGAVVSAFSIKEVYAPISAVLSPMIPRDRLALAIAIAITSPLAMFRGPYNILGLGAGIWSVIKGMKILPITQLVGIWLGTYRWIGCACPTVSWTAWIVGYTKISVREYLPRQMLYVWPLAALVTLSSLAFF